MIRLTVELLVMKIWGSFGNTLDLMLFVKLYLTVNLIRAENARMHIQILEGDTDFPLVFTFKGDPAFARGN